MSDYSYSIVCKASSISPIECCVLNMPRVEARQRARQFSFPSSHIHLNDGRMRHSATHNGCHKLVQRFYTPHGMSPTKHFSLGGGDCAGFDLLVKVAPERGGCLFAEGIAFLLRAKPLLRPFARTGDCLLRPCDRPLHGDRHPQQVNLSSALAKEKIRRNPPPLRFGEDAQRVGRR